MDEIDTAWAELTARTRTGGLGGNGHQNFTPSDYEGSRFVIAGSDAPPNYSASFEERLRIALDDAPPNPPHRSPHLNPAAN